MATSVEDEGLNLKREPGGNKNIQIPRRGLIRLNPDGTADDVNAANPLPTGDVAVAISNEDIALNTAGINAKMISDAVAGAQVDISFEHHVIHESAAFTIHYTRTTSSDDDHRTGIAFSTPAGAKKLHLVVTVASSEPAEFFLLEAPTNTTAENGVEKAVLNRDRVNSATASIVLSLEASPGAGNVSTYDEAAMVDAAFTGGTQLDYSLLAGGEGPFAIGGVSRSEQEFILKVSTDYVLYIKNVGASANIHSISANWYEHTDAA